ncbi:MAG: DUF1963 domain-containing protein [Pseudomonadota bacterium]
MQFGGLPRLPKDLDWPSPHLHFVCSIDLGKLPRRLEQAGQTFEMPVFPEQGTLFIFLRLEGDGLWDPGKLAVLYSPGPPEPELEEREPPEDILDLFFDYEYSLDPKEISPCGRMLKRHYAEIVPYLSYRAENPLWRTMDRYRTSPEEIYERDLAYAAQLKELGIDHHVPLPKPIAAREPLYDKIPVGRQGFFERGTFQWTWEYIFEWSKRVSVGLHELPAKHLEIEEITPDAHTLDVLAALERRKAEIQAQQFIDRSPWIKQNPGLDAPPDPRLECVRQVEKWMQYSRHRQSQGMPMAETDKTAFVTLLRNIQFNGRLDDVMPLRVYEDLPGLEGDGWYVEEACKHAFRDIAKERTDLHPGRATEPQFNFGDADQEARPTQMFGCGYLMQHAAIDHEDKVLLFQVSSCAGIAFDSGVLQIWIEPEDLAAGAFEAAIVTSETD